MILTVPDLEETAYPTLGPLVCQWIERNLVFGPGDLQHQPARLDPEKRALIYRFYEIMPWGAKDANGKPIHGRRRFRRCAISLQKGSAKTELAAWVAAAELHPEAPVRFDHFDGHGKAWGRGVPSAYIPLVAYTEEQSEDLAYGVLKDILEHCPISSDFSIGWERISRAGDPSSKALALAGAPNSRDGALTTFQHLDETHRWEALRLKRAATTMRANLTKRLMADPWELETTTAYSPGLGSVAEETAEYAKSVAEGKLSDSKLFYFHRQASDGFDWDDADSRREALVEAAGPTSAWKDIEGISSLWQDPKADRPYLERVYGNRPIATASQAFNASQWRRLARPEVVIEARRPIALGFDGSINDDATALIATDLELMHQWPIRIWEKPIGGADSWEVPRAEVDTAVDEAFSAFDVVLMYGDPSKWSAEMARWAGKYGKRVVEWATTAYRKMATSLRAYALAIEAGEVTNNGNPVFARHIGNAHRNPMGFVDEDGAPLWLIQKDRPGSPNKIDAAMAGCLSRQAAIDAIANGALNKPPSWHGILV